MSEPIITHKKADAISTGILLIGLGLISYLNAWWPWILLVIGFSLVLRQFLRGRHYDMVVTIFLFGGLFLFYYVNVGWDVLMPVIFTLAGLYVIFREYFLHKERVGKDKIVNDSREVEEDERDA